MSQATSESPSAAPEPQKKVKKRRTWKQRLKITAIVLIVAGILIRVAMTFLLPTVIRKVANAYDLDATFDRMSLGMLDGNAHIWNLELRPRSGGDSIVQADYIQGSISTPNLFRGRLVVYRAEVDGVDMLIDREPDGSIPLLDRLLSGPEDAPISVEPEPEPEPETSATTQPVNLQPPLRIDAVRLSHVKTTFRDRSVTPTFETTIRTSLRLSDVGADGIPAEFELQVQADPVLDALIVRGVLHSTPTAIEANLDVSLRGLHPKPAAVYLLPMGLRPLADDITVEAQANLTATTIPDSTDISALLSVRDISATADSDEWASLKTISLDARRINASLVELGQLLIETGRASARRSADGYVQVAGFELVPATAADADPAPAAPAATQEAPATPFRLTLDELRLADMEATFDDQAVEAEGALVARLDHLTARDIIFDTSSPDGVVTLDGSAALPGIVRVITWNGTVVPFADERQAAIKVRADGIKPDALRPYLDAMGLESQLAAGAFAADIDATNTTAADGTTTTARLANLRLTDRDATLLDLSSAAITNLWIDPEDGAIHVEAIDVTGPTLDLRLDADGALAVLGLRTQVDGAAGGAAPAPATPDAAAPGAPPAAAPAAPPTEPAESSPIKLPRVRIDRLAWNDIHLNFEDHHGAETPVVLQGRAGVEAADLVFDSAATQQVEPGRFNAWFELPGVVERLALDGSLQTTGEGVILASDFTGEGLTGSAITEYLKPLGIELTLKDGRLQGKAGATVVTTDDAVRVDLDLADMLYTDAGDELAGVGGLRIKGLALQPGHVAVDLVEIAQPRGHVTRHADGTLEAAGVRLVAPPPSTQPVAPQAVTAGPPAPLHLSAAPIDLLLKQLRLREAALRLTDRAVEPALDTVLRGNVELDDVTLQADAPARVAVNGAIDGIIDNASVTGTLSLATDARAAKLVIKADQIRGDALAGYMPPGMRSTLQDGQFAMTLDAALANHAEGGLTGHLAISDLLLHENTGNATLAKVNAFTVRIGRLDPAGGILAIDEVSSAGVELDVAQQPDGAIDLLGMRLGDSSQPPPAPAPAAAAAEPAPEMAVVATPQPAADVATMVADARRALPLLTLGTLDLKLDRLRMIGLTGPEAAPVEVARLRLHNSGPIELAGENPDQRPPLKLQIDGAIDPVMKQFGVAIEATPFDAEPELTVDVNASGINGKGLTDIAPELRNLVEGEGLTEGTFATRLVASLNYGRRGPRDVDLARGFTAAFSIKPLEFRGQPDGPVLAGLEEIRGEGINVQPRNGNLIIRSIEVVKPIGRFVRDEQGLHALGFVIPLKEAQTPGETEEVAVAAPTESAASPAPAAPAAPAERPASEIRLDRFTVTGIDLVFEDRTTDPPTQVPLRTLDLEVRDVSNQMLWTGRPVRFDMLCTSDKVPLPPRKGITASETDAESGLEMRELFSQITANGRIGLKRNETGAALAGWAKTSVSGFELLGVRGLAAAQDVIIGGGVFDDSNDIRFKEEGLIETRNRVVFTNLSLSEPPNGPIQRILQLPAPIDVAIGAITDPDGSITLNLPVTVESGTVDVGKLVAPAIGAVTQVMVTAIASAPIKAVGGVGDLLGLGGRGPRAPEEPVELAFLPGVATLEPAEARRLAILAERMRRDRNLELQLRHEMSPADVSHAEQRANPPAEDVRAMTERLRRSKAQLRAEREALAAQARAQYAAQSDAAIQSVRTLRSIDRRLTQIDTSLDQLGDLLRPGADAQADRRTRATSLEIAQERFDVIQAAIADARIPDAANRVRRTNPQFEPIDSLSHGRVVITLVTKKK